MKGPVDWFTGDAYIDGIVQPHGGSQLNVGAVFHAGGSHRMAFTRSSRTLYVTDGRGLVQSRGEPIAELHGGDVVWTPDGEEHGHRSAHDHFMTHRSLTEGAPTWGEHVTDAENRAATGS